MIGLLWRRAGQVTNSLVFRIGLLLALGLILASSAALGVAMQVHWHDLLTMRNEQVVASSADIAQRLQRDPDHTEELLSTGRILGARDAPQSWQMSQPDEDLGELLRARLGPASAAQAMSMPHEQCFPYFDMRLKAAGTSDFALPDCWFVRFRDPVGHWRALSIDLPTIRHPNSFPNAIYISLLVLACASLAFLVTSLLAWPLRRLTEAAHTFSLSVQPDAIPEVGPREVKSALVTFNLMQQRIRAGFTERTHMLGAIAHDLQTPLTRMRLRVEQIDEEALRGRLIADLSVMQRLVRDGLDLAR
ncbi:MAG TPA: histidine kinase, partial [Novosphingobium sp.]|nr:histidine kinase [Novosphingobium sp.]